MHSLEKLHTMSRSARRPRRWLAEMLSPSQTQLDILMGTIFAPLNRRNLFVGDQCIVQRKTVIASFRTYTATQSRCHMLKKLYVV